MITFWWISSHHERTGQGHGRTLLNRYQQRWPDHDLMSLRYCYPSRSLSREEDQDDQRRYGERRSSEGEPRSALGANRLLRFAGWLVPKPNQTEISISREQNGWVMMIGPLFQTFIILYFVCSLFFSCLKSLEINQSSNLINSVQEQSLIFFEVSFSFIFSRIFFVC